MIPARNSPAARVWMSFANICRKIQAVVKNRETAKTFLRPQRSMGYEAVIAPRNYPIKLSIYRDH